MNHITREEFDKRLAQLGEKLPLVTKLLELNPFDKWAEHLKRDAYKKLGVQPVTMYEVQECESTEGN